MDDKQQEAIYRKILRESAFEEAPPGFTRSVMDRIRKEKTVQVQAPLISGKVWAGIAAGVAGLALWGMTASGGSGEAPGFIGYLFDRSAALRIPKMGFPELPELPAPYLYGVGFLLVFAIFQMAWVKRYLDSRYSL
ncbi:hypothetical protein [Robiginitalea sp. SC105]|uniref:hypothetical protein n=1 Tax=Robiginitalea sp. SC105 TaxID=2762332 RepID=UPI001639B662|nr:hypothetical protein [Robiginitalea sp. SC105]MBC2839171.1 hypothetical protein [Robiginitalea sp. SC105]